MFLMKFADMSGGHPVLQGKSFASICEIMGFRRTIFYEIAGELEHKNLLERTEVRGATRRVMLTITDKTGSLIKAKTRLEYHPYRNLIRRILGTDGFPPPSNWPLTIPQRVLLIALLEEANAGGIVKNIGYSTLTERTGLNKLRIKHRLKLLSSDNLIRMTIHGGNRPGFIGRYTSAHSLNLSHPIYGGMAPAIDLLILRNHPASMNHGFVDCIADLKYEHLRGDKKADNLGIQGLTGKQQKLLPNLWEHLQWTYFELVSTTITNDWDKLSKTALEPLVRRIVEDLKQTLLPDHREALSEEAAKALQNVCHHIAFSAVLSAQWVKNLLEGLSLTPWNNGIHHLQLLPLKSTSADTFAIELIKPEVQSFTPPTVMLINSGKLMSGDSEGGAPKERGAPISVEELTSLPYDLLQRLGLAHLTPSLPKHQTSLNPGSPN